MEMTGEQTVPRGQQAVWDALNDRDVLEACVPGCESLEQTSDTEFKAKIRTAVGPVKSQFKGRVTLSDMAPPESYNLAFKGDGTAGFVKGSADVRLVPVESGEGTTIRYAAQATVGGKLAQIGSRVVDGAARKMADDFFANLTTHLGGTPKAAHKTAEADKKSVSETPAADAGSGWSRFLAAIRRAWAKLFGGGRDS